MEDTENFAPTDSFAPWMRYLLYIEAAKARCEIPMSYRDWAATHNLNVEPDDDDGTGD